MSVRDRVKDRVKVGDRVSKMMKNGFVEQAEMGVRLGMAGHLI